MSTGKPLRVRLFVFVLLSTPWTLFLIFFFFASLHSHHTGGAGSSPRDEEHQSAAVPERATGAPEEAPGANNPLPLKTPTSTRPEKAADTTVVDAELLEHVSIFCLSLANSCVGCANSAPDGSSPRRCA